MLKTSEYQFVGYWDADLATPLTEIQVFIQKFKSNNELKAVCGSRVLRLGSSIRRSVFRHYFGRIFATIVSNILNIPVYDTQCGAKIFLAEFAEIIFSETNFKDSGLGVDSVWIINICILYQTNFITYIF